MKLQNITKILAGLSLALPMMAAQASAVTSLVGDKDCFGTGGVCTEGVWLPGGWSIFSTGSDPAFTDRVINTSATQSWTHSLTAGSYSSATLTFRTAGIADITGPYTIYVDGTAVGALPLDGYGHIEVQTFSFAINPLLLADGLATVSFTPNSSDSWAIDYAEIVATGSVPEPTSMALVALGLIGLAGKSRRKAA